MIRTLYLIEQGPGSEVAFRHWQFGGEFVPDSDAADTLDDAMQACGGGDTDLGPDLEAVAASSYLRGGVITQAGRVGLYGLMHSIDPADGLTGAVLQAEDDRQIVSGTYEAVVDALASIPWAAFDIVDRYGRAAVLKSNGSTEVHYAPIDMVDAGEAAFAARTGANAKYYQYDVAVDGDTVRMQSSDVREVMGVLSDAGLFTPIEQ